MYFFHKTRDDNFLPLLALNVLHSQCLSCISEPVCKVAADLACSFEAEADPALTVEALLGITWEHLLRAKPVLVDLTA